ncbi:MAG: 4Fe-4S binding protein [Archaeoglobi archaeon]|nr:4Fe-4S binding protein [Candidatus Mnemosynella sp.]
MIVVDHSLCKKCGICVEICPKGALHLNSELQVDFERCASCGFCEIYCPDFALEVVKDG